MLTSRLQAAGKLKWRLVRNFARRRPAEAALRLLMVGFMLLAFLPAAVMIAQGAAHQSLGWLWSGGYLWLLFAAVTMGQLTIGRLWNSIDLDQLSAFPLSGMDFFGIVLLDSALSEMLIIWLLYLGPIVVLLFARPLSLLVLLPSMLLFALFLLGWAYLLSGLRSYLISRGAFQVVAQVVSLAVLLYIGAFLLLPGLADGGQTYLTMGYWEHRLAAAQAFLAGWMPFLRATPPGLAADCFALAIRGELGPTALKLPLLALETIAVLAFMYPVTRAAQRGLITLGITQPKRGQEAVRRRFATRPPFGAGWPERFAGIGFWQLVRKEWLYARRFQVIVMQVFLAPMGWLFCVLFLWIGEEVFPPSAAKWMLAGAAFISCWFACEVFAQKFNWDGHSAGFLFLTPLPRETMLAAKSFAVMAPVALVNLAGLLVAWSLTAASAAALLCAFTLLACGLFISDAHGDIISSLAPVNLQFVHGAKKRRTLGQRGCITEFLLHIATFLLLLTLLPLFAVLLPGLILDSLLWAMVGSALCAVATWFYCRLLQREAVKLLLLRESAIWRTLKERP
jgi:hypothetical protein